MAISSARISFCFLQFSKGKHTGNNDIDVIFTQFKGSWYFIGMHSIRLFERNQRNTIKRLGAGNKWRCITDIRNNGMRSTKTSFQLHAMINEWSVMEKPVAPDPLWLMESCGVLFPHFQLLSTLSKRHCSRFLEKIVPHRVTYKLLPLSTAQNITFQLSPIKCEIWLYIIKVSYSLEFYYRMQVFLLHFLTARSVCLIRFFNSFQLSFLHVTVNVEVLGDANGWLHLFLY